MLYISVASLLTTYTRYGKQLRTMSKLAIVLCVALLASSAHGFFNWSKSLKAAQDKVDGIISEATSRVKGQFNAAKDKANDIATQLRDAATSFAEKGYNEIKSSLLKTEAKVADLFGENDGVDVSNCRKLVGHLDYTALSVMSNISSCVVDNLETGGAYVESIIKVAEDVLANLTAIKDEAFHCADHVNGYKSAAAAVVCVNMAAAKATWVTAQTVPTLTITIGKLTYMLSTLQPSLALCATNNGLNTFYSESATIVDKTRQCIEQKIAEARGVTTESQEHEIKTYTTETIQTTEEEHITEVDHTTDCVNTTPEQMYFTEAVPNTTEEAADNVAQE